MSAATPLLMTITFILAVGPATLAQTETCNFTLFYYGQPALMTPAGVNNSGTVIGTYFDRENRARGFIRSPEGHVTSYQVPNLPASQWVFLRGINDKGQIVGQVSDQAESGFVMTGGNVAPLTFPGASWTVPYSINNAGEVVGAYVRGVESERGFLYKGGRFISLTVPGSIVTVPSGINDAGVIVGYFADSKSVNHGFVRIGNRYITLDFPGASWTMITGINNRGEIVGNYSIPPSPALGFVYKEGLFKIVDVPSMYSAQALAVNGRGDLVGVTFTAGYKEKGFLRTQCH